MRKSDMPILEVIVSKVEELSDQVRIMQLDQADMKIKLTHLENKDRKLRRNMNAFKETQGSLRNSHDNFSIVINSLKTKLNNISESINALKDRISIDKAECFEIRKRVITLEHLNDHNKTISVRDEN